MSATISEVLDELRAQSTSESDKGSRLERLIEQYLQTDPTYADQFSDVWRWSDWPGRQGRPDTGIDLVAQDRFTGELVAIQSKFFAPGSTISKPDIDSFLSASGKEGFSKRIIVSTTEKWNRNAEDAIHGQQIPVRRISMSDLEASVVDWEAFDWARPEVLPVTDKKKVRGYQAAAISDVTAGLAGSDRGKLVMACGTGKTFTSLRLAEQMVGAGGRVLFLVPSISLLSQTLREWTAQAEVDLAPIAVCSDRKATKRSTQDEDISTADLALPSTTNPEVLAERLAAAGRLGAMTVVFSTYQSIDVVAQAQAGAGAGEFDLIICDEAHRTTGVTVAGEDESAFVKVHDNGYLAGRKRLYMTATPRIYDDSAKARAGEASAVLASMDNEDTYGPELHRLGFGEAVEKGLLSDYKVLVLAVDEKSVSQTFQLQLADEGNELRLDDAAKIVGCWNGLSKRGTSEHSFDADPFPMRRAVAFSGTIKASKQIESLFGSTVAQYAAAHDLEGEAGDPPLACEIQHVDGSFNALERNTRLDWLRAQVPEGTCRILTNARCLSEGVDVPALDAVMFLSPRKSEVDIVQAVGRVMRKAPGKKYGYIILPIGVPAGMSAEEALRDNKRYAAVWEVLQALRAHDERFNAMVNRIDLNKDRDTKINIIGVPGGDTPDRPGTDPTPATQGVLDLAMLGEYRDALYAKLVNKVGSRTYWEDWAKDIATIAGQHITRITALLDTSNGNGDSATAEVFESFLTGLRGILNEGITRDEAIEMLAQHLITRPVFEAVFAGTAFTQHNPVAQSMERMLTALDEHHLDNANESLAKFYDSVAMRASGIDTATGRQRLIVKLYDTFFATAFKKTVDRLGIVYTPVEIVDFMLQSADDVLREHFGQGLSDEGVHVLDGFTGTGTFIVRLIQSGLVTPHDLARKYATELHANEMLLLAYYIAAVNIETAYHDQAREHLNADAGYEPFPGLVLTDTFQSYEDGDTDALDVFPVTSERIAKQRGLPITVIIGNPPYSSGQKSANDDAANQPYPHLDAAIRDTYAARSTATNKNSLYDSYIRAIKWASLRIGDRGLIAYITNGGWLDSNTADGMRQTLTEEFSDIHIYNLKGNMRSPQWRREGGQIFGAGSQATIAITVLVKDPTHTGPATIHYTDIGDYLTRDQKLTTITDARTIASLPATHITPNQHGDWLNQRRDDFGTFIPLAQKGSAEAIFGLYSGGLKTNRDLWCYNFDHQAVTGNMARLVATYEADRATGRSSKSATNDPSRISWNRGLLADLDKNRERTFSLDAVRPGCYRPFMRQHTYFDRTLNDMVYRLNELFPTPNHPNHGFYMVGVGAVKQFAVLAVNQLPDLNFYGSEGGQFFARWRYEKVDDDGRFDIGTGDGEAIDGYRRIDNITDHALAQFTAAYGDHFTKDGIFDYCYGLLHSPEYRATYGADLKKALPRIPLVTDAAPYVNAGRALRELHLRYESVEPHPLIDIDTSPPAGADPYEFYRVDKMRFAKTRDPETGKLVADRTSIIYNSRITLTCIPEDAYAYQLGSRSAIEWIIDRYQVKTDKPSGITNDPNDWSREIGDPRYALDLLARIVTISLETNRIVNSLPALQVLER